MYQDVTNKTVCRKSKHIYELAVWEEYTPDNWIFWCGRVSYSNSIIFMSSPTPNCLFENIFPTHLCNGTSLQNFMCYLGNWCNAHSTSS